VLGIVVFGVPFRGNVLLYSVLTFLLPARVPRPRDLHLAATRSQLLATQVAMIGDVPAGVPAVGVHVPRGRDAGAAPPAHLVVPARYYVVVTRRHLPEGRRPRRPPVAGAPDDRFAAFGLALATRSFRKELR